VYNGPRKLDHKTAKSKVRYNDHDNYEKAQRITQPVFTGVQG
jgi:hypothetical protein